MKIGHEIMVCFNLSPCKLTVSVNILKVEVEDHSFVCLQNISIKLCAQIRTGRAVIGCY